MVSHVVGHRFKVAIRSIGEEEALHIGSPFSNIIVVAQDSPGSIYSFRTCTIAEQIPIHDYRIFLLPIRTIYSTAILTVLITLMSLPDPKDLLRIIVISAVFISSALAAFHTGTSRSPFTKTSNIIPSPAHIWAEV
ncbi:hypothetical protein B0J11DRAFT_318052 [Dendryphion nanum]|uniref:Uncharacterized protein n=1 Tax=Dendryphion nanum TaxID=256645 RepID=A0A9P9IKB2_9PLEO|nr:hypothetical protein B0J11DRAFT_318052 [Dendryphion nanum]